MAAPVIHYTFDIDGTNSGTGGSSSDITLGTTTIDTTNKLTGTGSVSSPEYTNAGAGVPQFDYNTGTTGTTISFWARLQPGNGGNRFIYSSQPSPGGTVYNPMDSLWSTNSGQLQYYGTVGSGATTLTGDFNLYNDRWRHFVITCSGGASRTVSVYLDNSILSSTILTTGLADNTDQRIWLAGCYYGEAPGGSNDRGLYGNIDNFRIHDYVLTTAQVDTLYWLEYVFEAPVIHYTFDTDGTNSGTLGTANNLTIPTDFSIDDTNQLIGTKCLKAIGQSTASSATTQTTFPAWTTPDNFTISFWGKCSAWTSTNHRLLDLTINGTLVVIAFQTDPLDHPNPPHKMLFFNDSNNAVTNITIPNTFDNAYHHFVLTFSGTTADFYIDNVLYTPQVSFPFSFSQKSITALAIGSSLAADPTYNGYIDDFRIYAYALTTAQINTLYISGRIYTAPIIHYPFDVDGTNSGSFSSTQNLTIPGSLSLDINALIGNKCLSFPTGSLSSSHLTSTNTWTTPANGMLISFWVKAGAWQGGHTYLLYMIIDSKEFQLYYNVNNNKIALYVTNSVNNSQQLIDTDNVYNIHGDDTWHHFAITFVGSTSKVYLDNVGTNLEIGNTGDYTNKTVTVMQLGARSGNYGIGLIDDFRIYDYITNEPAMIDMIYKLGSNTNVAGLSGAPMSSLQNTGATLAQMITTGVTVTELLTVYTITQLAAGVSVSVLLDGGVSVAQLLAENITVAQLLDGGATVAQLLAENITVAQLLDGGATATQLLAVGVSIADILAAGVVPDWNLDTDANHFDQSYVKGFVDLSGSVVIRNDNKLITNADLSLGGNLTINPTPAIVGNHTLSSAYLIEQGYKYTQAGGLTGVLPGINSPNETSEIAWVYDGTSTPVVRPLEITNAKVNSLNDIVVTDARMCGNGLSTHTLLIPRFCKYKDSGGNEIPGEWIMGVKPDSYTRMAKIKFTLNGITPSVEWVERGYKSGSFIDSDANMIDAYNTGSTNIAHRHAVTDLAFTTTYIPPPGTTSFNIDDMTLKSNLFIGDDISANGNLYVGGDLSVNGQFSGNFANDIIPSSAINISSTAEIVGNVHFMGDVSFNGSTVEFIKNPFIARIPDSYLTDIYLFGGIDHKLIPQSSPVVIQDVYINSLTNIEPSSAFITGESVTELYKSIIYKYQDANGNIVPDNWVCGNYETALNITRVCRIAFTLNGITPSIQQISRAYNTNYSSSDTGSALGNGNYTSTAADLSKLFNDTNVGTTTTGDLNYALTNFYYKCNTMPQSAARRNIPHNDLVVQGSNLILPATTPIVLSNVSINSLDEIEPADGLLMCGSAINQGGAASEPCVFYKYPVDENGNALEGNWIFAYREAHPSGDYTKSVRIAFTLNGTTPSIQQLGQTHDGGTGTDYTSSATDLIALYNDGVGYYTANINLYSLDKFSYKVFTDNFVIPESICDTVTGYVTSGTGLTYHILPLVSTVIPNITINSLDKIELISAYMAGAAIADGAFPCTLFKYQDANGNIVPGNWVCGTYDGTYTKAVLIEFTLNGTALSVVHLLKSYQNLNTGSVLGNSDYSSTAADLSKMFNDSSIGNTGYGNGYAITNVSIKVSNTVSVNQVEFNDGTTMTTYDDNILSGTFANSNVVFKDSTFTSVICEGAATATTVQSSDYRIKENVTELNETDTVDSLIPIQYNNTVSGNHEFGLLAHELQEIYPDLVNGEKDGTEYQQVHYNGLIGVLVKEVQDLKQRLAVLNNR